MRAHVASAAPLEACGLVAGKLGVSKAVFCGRNELASSTRFRLEPRQQLEFFLQMEREGWDLMAIFHSHPAGPSLPSATDLDEALYPGVVHLIWFPQNGEWNCAAFLLDGGRVADAGWKLV